MRLIVLVAVMAAVSAWTKSGSSAELPPPDLSQLLQAIREAREKYHLPTDDELTEAKAAVQTAYDQLIARLADLPNGQSTGDDLGLPALHEALPQVPPDVTALDRADNALHRNRPGAKGDEFERLRSAVERYLHLVRASQAADLPQKFNEQIDRLEKALTRYAAERSAENLAAVIEPFLWLWNHGQVRELLVDVRKQTVHSNHRMRFSALFIDRLVAQPVNRPLSSNEMNEGARVIVQGTLDGKLSSVLVPHESQGVIHVGFNGVGNSNISAYKGRATVHGRGQTNIHASQPVYLTTNGFQVGTPQSDVRHRTSGNTVSVRMKCPVLRRLATKMAAKVVGRQQPANDCKAAARTRRQVEERLQVESVRLAKEGNQTIDAFGLFAALGPDPQSRLKLRTTTEYLEWLGRYAGDTQFASPAGPPDFAPGDHAVLFQIHESAINNSERFVAGEAVNEADFRELIYNSLGLVPIDDDKVAGRIPATITFTEENPLDVRIHDGQVFIKFRLQKVSEDHAVEGAGPYTVSTSYAPKTGPDGTKIVRSSPITIEPADAPGMDKLQEILSRFFVTEADPRGTRPLAALLKPDTLRVYQLKLVDGWLTLVLNLEKGGRRD
jgi:hypothetical protein